MFISNSQKKKIKFYEKFFNEKKTRKKVLDGRCLVEDLTKYTSRRRGYLQENII